MEKEENKLKFDYFIPALAMFVGVPFVAWLLGYKTNFWSSILSLLPFAFLFSVLFWRFIVGRFALAYKPSLIPYFFKDKKDKGSFVITENYFLGKYYFDRADYPKAEKYFFKSMEEYFYKKVDFKINESSENTTSTPLFKGKNKASLESQIDEFYKNNNDFIAFLKSSWLYLVEFIKKINNIMDWFYLQGKPVLYWIKTKKILYPDDKFLQDYDEEKALFLENINDKEQEYNQGISSGLFFGTPDFLCIQSKILLDLGNYDFYRNALENCTNSIEEVQKSSNQTILWRLLYVRGCAYHKLGDADLACKDWKRGIELGDVEFSQKMYEENCKES
ncbi:hypothetical protein ACE193_08980 [Bernardetia sp. OM2101]|uniref:hypothetical protein n=1 Tax=Bernardetia sp. OM2101 TaxID=3344876 RepID=UPI0035CFCCE4